jgi:PilZ domain
MDGEGNSMVDMIPLVERRKHRRFIVSGKVQFTAGFDSGLGSLVNLGEGGLLIRSRALLPEGTKGTFHVHPSRCPIEFEIEGQVVGVKGSVMAVQFLEKRPEVSDCVQWLASENCPWTGPVSMEVSGASRPEPTIPSEIAEPAIRELEIAHELVFQSA